jgi:hypothetical protein
MNDTRQPIMKPEQRRDWIEAFMRGNNQARGGVDICDAAFVDAYTEATNAPYSVTMYGANKCRMLGRDLSIMAGAGVLRRSRIGLDGMAGMGFPRWVWSYRLTHSS